MGDPGRPLRVLHVENQGGVAWQIAQAQRALGLEATVLVTNPTRFGHPHDLENPYGGGKLRTLRRMLHTIRLARDYDVLHMHGGIRRSRMDVVGARAFSGVAVVVHYHGSETRLGYGMAHAGAIDSKVVATPDLLEAHPEARFRPSPYGPVPAYTPHTGPLRIVHLPSKRAMKGTDTVLRAIDRLRATRQEDDAAFFFELVEGVDHDTALAEIDRADVVIDQFVPPTEQAMAEGRPVGLFGMVSLEAMARGRLAVAALRPDIDTFYPGCPIRSADDEDGLVALLAKLVADPDRARQVGRESRDYVIAHHDPVGYARFTLDVYAEALEGRHGAGAAAAQRPIPR